MADKFEIDSMATSREELGNTIYPPARRKLEQEGVPVLFHQARQMKKEDYDRFDYIIIMDEQNKRNIMKIVGSDPAGKIRKALEYADKPHDIADPWYTGNFDITYDQLVEACESFLDYLEGEGLIDESWNMFS